jgi:hypothetical protein
VWSGYDPAFSELGYFNLQAHQRKDGSQFLSFFRGMSVKGRGRGSVILLDDSYAIMRELTSSDPKVALDFHEVSIRDEGTKAILTVYPTRQMDLSLFNITQGLGWVLDSTFRELDIETGKVLFEWSASDHIPLSESTITPMLETGGGQSSHYPFDYCHVNSVDKFANGDYLISARHTNTIYRISHVDGTIIWRLGGNDSSVGLQGYDFAAQHDARIHSESPDGDKFELTFFNNADNGQYHTRDFSSALHVVVSNLTSGTATSRIIHEWLPLDGGLARHQGTVQHRLPSTNNTLVSWGQVAEFSEFAPPGERVMDVAFADELLHVYRVMKAPWIGRPKTKPDLYLYARSPEDKLQFYMSWNGATEVEEWRCYGVEGGIKTVLGVVRKNGFETHFEWDGFMGSGFVEALDGDGNVLETSKYVNVTLPPTHMADRCSVSDCSVQMLQIKKPRQLLEESRVATGFVAESSLAWDLRVWQLILPLLVGWLFGRFGLQFWSFPSRHSRVALRGLG